MGEFQFSDNRALLEAIEVARERLASELDGLGRAVKLLEQHQGGQSTEATPTVNHRRPRSRRRKPAAGTPAEVQKRCDAVDELLAEKRVDLSSAQIAKQLGLTLHTVRTALTRLIEKKAVKSIGEGRMTRYRTLRPLLTEQVETTTGRFIEIVRDRGYASHEELAQALGISREQVVEIGGELVAEGELEMDSRSGRAVFIVPGRMS